MKLSDLKDILFLSALGVGAYLIWKNWPKLPSPADVARAGQESGSLISRAIFGAPQALGQIRLTDGTVIAVNDVVKAGGAIDSSGGFTWRGVRYQILSLGPDGVYDVM